MAPEPPRKRVLGIEVREEVDDDAARRRQIDSERAAERRANEMQLRAKRVVPPPIPKPEYQRSFTPFDLPTVERAPLPEHPAPPSRRTWFPQSRIPSWAAGLAAVISAISGAVVAVLIALSTRAPAAKPAEVVRVGGEARDRDRDQNMYLAAIREDELIKDQIILAWICAQNSNVPVARNVECPEIRCEPTPVLRDGKIVPKAMACRTEVAWPPVRRAPKP
jgi:hypothetical protein